jgi:ABC-type transporter Mla MlaB component
MTIGKKLDQAGGSGEKSCLTLSLAGKLHGGRIGELRREIEEARRTNREVVIDLSEVTLVDRPCVRFLGELEHVTVINCPEYIRPWIGRQPYRQETADRQKTP